MNVAWNTRNFRPTDEPISRLLEITSMRDGSPGGTIMGVISAVEGRGYFRGSVSLDYGCVFDEGLLHELKDIAARLESELTAEETRQIREGEKALGNSGALAKVREDFFSVLTNERLLKLLVELVGETKGEVKQA